MKTIVKKRSAKPAQAVVKPAPGLVKPDMWRLRLYVAGQTPKSLTAFANLKRLCEERLRDRYAIEVVDLLEQPQLAKDDQILAIPTVVRKLPAPMRKIIGDLSNTEHVLVGMDLLAEADRSARGGGPS